MDISDSLWQNMVYIQKIELKEINGWIKLYIREMSGTKQDDVSKPEGDRADVSVFVPIIYVETTNLSKDYEILKAEGIEYKVERVPSCFWLSKKLIVEIEQDTLIIINRENSKSILEIKLSVDTYEVIKNLRNITLFMVADGKSYVSSIPTRYNQEKISVFPFVYNMSIFGKNQDLKEIIPKISKFNQNVVFKPDIMLGDLQGSSDYYVYESTFEQESLPSNRSLTFNSCFACGKKEKSREHCSPKWIADKYQVKPLVADIFCKECNNWFGVNLENRMQQYVQTNRIRCEDLARWCIKTSLAMSIASGVPLNTTDLQTLRRDIVPGGYEVFFNRIGSQNRGFYYGVSHFAMQIRERGTFLFTFLALDFSFIVIKNNEGVELDVPINKIWPQQVSQKVTGILNFTDVHQYLHETLARERTIDGVLKIRPQKR